jgi:glycerol-1-phosphate dehydrogenase [NAD(P)+]
MTTSLARSYRDPRDLAALTRALKLDATGSALHPIGTRTIEIGANALDAIDEIVARTMGDGPIALLMDTTPMRRGRLDLKSHVADRLRDLRPVVAIELGQPGSDLHAEAAEIERATVAAAGAGALVAVGSGTICDIGKEVSRQLSLPYTVVQTANSVNAFSDDMAVLLVRGVKRTVPSRWPDALIVDLEVLAGAPAAMNRAGVGELTSMWTAPADWRLAAAVGADPSWDQRVVALFRDGSQALVAAAPGATTDLTSIEVMAELMTLSGLALGIAGRTAPISGTEHGISHLLDISAASDGRPTGLHGAQVGVGALIAAVIWERVLDVIEPSALNAPQLCNHGTAKAEIDAAFGAIDDSGEAAAECWAHYRAKLDSWAANAPARAAAARDWERISDELRHLLVPSAVIAALLRSAGSPATFEELDPQISLERQIWAVLSSPLQRERFSVADLAQAAGVWDRDFVRDVIAQATHIARSTDVGPLRSAEVTA